LKRVSPVHKSKIESALEQIATFGIPNYFGFQRIANDGDNYLKGKDIIDKKLKEKNRKLKQMYINAYQSYLFNAWLSKRIEVSKLINNFKADEISTKIDLDAKSIKNIQKQKHPFKILQGDIFNHYPYGKLFYVENIDEESDKFYNRDRVPTGLLAGTKTKIALDDALKFETEFIKETQENGARRFAWIFPTNIESEYKEEKAWFELNFELPKGSYATEFISELLHKQLT
jgi:tRNA pseudouridine13 synthase